MRALGYVMAEFVRFTLDDGSELLFPATYREGHKDDARPISGNALLSPIASRLWEQSAASPPAGDVTLSRGRCPPRYPRRRRAGERPSVPSYLGRRPPPLLSVVACPSWVPQMKLTLST